MKNLSIEIQEDIFEQASIVLEDLGLDIDSAIRMFLKRVVREQSVAFVLQNINTVPQINQNRPESNAIKSESEKIDRGEMRKSLAVKMFKDRGMYIDKNVTYSSKNRTTYNYWSNPNFSVLYEDWSLILNDWINRKLYLFRIPGNAISPSQLVPRNDQKDLIDIQIPDDEPGFKDKRSGFRFINFLVDTVDY